MNHLARYAVLAAAISSIISASAHAALTAPPSDLATWTCTGNCGTLGADGDIGLSPLGNSRYGFVSTSDGVPGVSPLSLSDNHLGAETNGSKIFSGAFSASQNDRLDMHFNYVSTDGNGYDDYAWARLLNADNNTLVSWLFTARSTNSGANKIIPGDVVKRNEFDPSAMITNYDSYQFTAKTANWSPLGFSNNTCWEEDAKGCGFTGWLQSSLTFAQAGNYRIEVGVTNWADGAYDSGLAFDYRTLSDSRAAAPVPEPGAYAMFLAGLGFLGLIARRRGDVPFIDAESAEG